MAARNMRSAGALSTPEPKGRRTQRPADSVERVYKAVKELAVQYSFPPGTRVNEVDLARRLGVSRTPIREALNRLVRDGFMRFVPNRGFFTRELTPDLVRDLYELRAAIEVAAVKLACQRGSDEDIARLRATWEQAVARFASRRLDRMAEADEAFHMGIARLSGNRELITALEGLNSQIRFFRRVDQESRSRRDDTYREHSEILACLAARDARRAATVMETHVVFSQEHALAVTKEVVARIYVTGPRTSRGRVSSATGSTAPSTARRRRRSPSAVGRQ
jgi:DNA-binding GntR family transcriptional regulator